MTGEQVQWKLRSSSTCLIIITKPDWIMTIDFLFGLIKNNFLLLSRGLIKGKHPNCLSISTGKIQTITALSPGFTPFELHNGNKTLTVPLRPFTRSFYIWTALPLAIWFCGFCEKYVIPDMNSHSNWQRMGCCFHYWVENIASPCVLWLLIHILLMPNF